MLAMQYEYAHVGMGYHTLDIPPENTVYIFKVKQPISPFLVSRELS